MWDNTILKSVHGIEGVVVGDILVTLVARLKGPGVIVSESVIGPRGIEAPGPINVFYSWHML